MAEDQAVTNFREYLRIKTVQPKPDYDGAVVFLKKMAGELGLPYQIFEMEKGKPILIMALEGTDPTLSSLLLNSHTDVVPVFKNQWKVEPFSADKMENGDIYGRGTQDMKSVGIQYIEAIRRLKAKGKKFLRTIHLSFVPEYHSCQKTPKLSYSEERLGCPSSDDYDGKLSTLSDWSDSNEKVCENYGLNDDYGRDEEIGGHGGMEKFVKDEQFKKLNVGFSLDEGLANPSNKFTVFFAEKSALGIRVKCPGKPGHGSRFIEDTAAEKVHKIITRFLELRSKEEKKYKENCLKLGEVTTVNLTKLEGGVQVNVVPDEFIAYFDVRIDPREDLSVFENMLKQWCLEAGKDVTYEFLQKGLCQELTSTEKSNPWWNAFSTALEKMGYEYEKEIFPAGTDSRFLREIGLPAIGFSPMNNTPILLHDHNEFLNENVFLNGIKVYEELIPSIASVPKF